MPNWCSNRLTVSGTCRQLSPLVKFLKDHEANWCHTIDPTPLELLEDVSPEEKRVHEQVCAEKYGHRDWYDWCVAHWGTKWDVEIGDCEIAADAHSIVYNFDSAWAPPEAIVRKTSKIFPKLTFCLEYCEPGNAFAGVVTYLNGWCMNEAKFNDSEHPGYQKMCESFGYSLENDE